MLQAPSVEYLAKVGKQQFAQARGVVIVLGCESQSGIAHQLGPLAARDLGDGVERPPAVSGAIDQRLHFGRHCAKLGPVVPRPPRGLAL